MERFYIEVEGSDEKLEVVTSLSDETIIENIKTMLDNNENEYGHLNLKGIPREEIECYDWDEYDQEVIDLLDSRSELYELCDGIGDFEQPLGVVALLRK